MEEEENFDLIQPTLIQQVKKILDQYPDDGQILKELIQNAEDAEASEVRILFDHHSYGTTHLFNPELAKFQGPALYAYNDGKFSNADWKGIRMLCDSIKVKDPMKVGRFGLGFKSVFHMTDLPSVVSDDHLLVIDPHEKFLNDSTQRRTGKGWHLQKDTHAMHNIPDQFAPYKGIFDCTEESFTRGRYDGTLFRFPLRQEVSKLSENLYSEEKIHGLFHCFQKEAPLSLLFMKNLESISLYERSLDEFEARKLFHVKIADSCLKDVRQKRREFMDQVRNLRLTSPDSSVDPVKVTYPITIETLYTEDGTVSSHAFMVTQYYSGNKVSCELQSLMVDESLSYMPWMGVALPLLSQDEKQVIGNTTYDDLQNKWNNNIGSHPKGHLFCFLPLPLEQKSLTGLPVHVNGFFALSQNRRHLKWPSADQEDSGEPITDKSLLWNKCLLQEVLPEAYAELVLQMVAFSETGSIELDQGSAQLSSDKLMTAIYSAWPDHQHVDPKWKILLKPFFNKILSCAVLYSKVRGGKWLQLNDVVLDKLEAADVTRTAVISALLNSGQNIVTVPPHIASMISTFYAKDVKAISPKSVRDVLRSDPQCYASFTYSDKISLLKFVLRDGRFIDLHGLRLLPLSNKKFIEFSNMWDRQVYIPSYEHPQTLLLGLEERFVDASDAFVVEQFRKIADAGNTQVRHLNKEAVATLLPDALPSNWRCPGQDILWYPDNSFVNSPSLIWLQELWAYLGSHFKEAQALARFQGLPLIPVTPLSLRPVKLTCLQSPSSILVRRGMGNSVSEPVVRLLVQFGLTVLEELPTFVSYHPALVPCFVKRPDPTGVVDALVEFFRNQPQVLSKVEKSKVSPDNAQALRELLSRTQTSKVQKQILRKLPLFKTLEVSGMKNCEIVSCNQVPEGFTTDDLPPVPLHKKLLDLRDESSRSLSHTLSIKQLHPMDLVEELLQGVKDQRFTGSDIDKLMGYTFKHLPLYSHKGIIQQRLKTTPFVSISNGQRKMPRELFDPEQPSLQSLFANESDRFPYEGSLYREKTVLNELRELGLKGEDGITAANIVFSTEMINSIRDSNIAREKSNAILQHLSSHPQMLRANVGSLKLEQCLKDIQWVPTMKEKPAMYPNNIPLGCKEMFERPSNMKDKRFAAVVGTIKPIVAYQTSISAEVANVFGWNLKPCVGDVLLHLKHVISGYDVRDKAAFIGVVNEVYKYLEQVDSVQVAQEVNSLGLSSWVWNGDGFSSPNDVVLQKPLMDLSPYVCILPTETREHCSLFYSFGMKAKCDVVSLVHVLAKIRDKHSSGSASKEDTRRDLQMAIDILNELKPNSGETLEEEVLERLLIPLDSDSENELKFAPIEDCTYCDLEWLKQGHDSSDVEEDDEIEIKFIHRNIPIATASDLGVPTLMNRMLEAEELDIGESFGQHEPLTRRLNRLLEEYTDGFSVPKELIQNADDAGATEVRFLYDERTNENAMTCLIDEGMKECQGPALWAYNNAVFSDTDFENITKLNGATKEEDAGKIGRFGLGFNAVYNLTDVPSLVSRNNFVVFDPHTTYLGRGIRDKSKPGIKVNLTKNRKKMRKLANQFKPYNGIFGCDLRPTSEQMSFNGTLFRFPLRTKEQARRSEIKALHYDNQQVVELLRMLVSGAESLLLFTQNVCKVSIYHLPKESSIDCLQPVELISITKSGVKVIRELRADVPLSAPVKALPIDEQAFAKQCNILKASSEIMKQNRELETSTPTKIIESSMLVKVNCSVTDSGSKLLASSQFDVHSQSCNWMVTSNMVGGSALAFSRSSRSLIPTAGAAVRLKELGSGAFIPVPIQSCTERQGRGNAFEQHNGRVFCFLPLPIHSGLPVHINGSFATDSSRRHLREKTEDDKSDVAATWNEVLMKEAVCQAYLTLLEDVKTVLPAGATGYQFHSLWPRAYDVNPSCVVLLVQFYKYLCAIPDTIPPALFSDGKIWSDISRVVFLHPDVRNDNRIGDTALEAFRLLRAKKNVVIDIPEGIYRSFEKSECMRAIHTLCYGKLRAYRDLFLPAIAASLIPDEMRDKLVLYALDDDSGRTEEDLGSLLADYRCIPVSPDGKTLKYPKDLIHPHGKAATLFCEEDGKFPFGENYNNESRLHKLVQLGMRTDDLEWEEIVERARSVETLNERQVSQAHENALSRTRAILIFIDHKLESNSQVDTSVIQAMQHIAFLPCLKKPNSTPFSWKSDEFELTTLLAAKDLHSKEHKRLVGAAMPLLNDYKTGCSPLTHKVEKLLNIKKSVTLDQVKKQLETVIAVDLECNDTASMEEVKKVCEAVYKYLHKNLTGNEMEIKEFLIPIKFILHERRFLSTDQVAFRCDVDLSPFLHALPRDYIENYPLLFRTLDMREAFGPQDYVSTLISIKTHYQDEIVDQKTLHVTVEIAVLLASVQLNITSTRGGIYLPDSRGVMRKSNELSMKDCIWMPDEEGVNYAIDRIPPKVCTRLGVNTRRQETLRKHTFGIPFGQKEELTNRLRRILDGYPCGGAILKELLQNADDAQATTICFIKDARHHPDERVFEESWKPLQGPALCVYNNSPFTKKDIRGIQSLGEGSKGNDPNKTGQYGVGFNAVYHLTDVPSFISKGEEIGEMMCVFDPHFKYVPGATKEQPGMAFEDLPHLRSIFSDVFPCYLDEHFPVDNATMFRFPLRNEAMARESKLCKKEMTVDELDGLMSTFKEELFDTLLFVNNVREISLCEMDEVSGMPVKEYKVTATLTKEDQRKREEFGAYVKEVAKKLSEGSVSMEQITKKEVSYVVDLEDSKGVSQTWVVVQRIGFDEGAMIPESVSSAVSKKELGLLPRGGVATLIKSSTSSRSVPGRAFCFLPLPFKTGLPVHVNGHFALDHEARRSLWRDDNPAGYRGAWNYMLLWMVVAPCYVNLLDNVRQYMEIPVSDSHANRSRENAERVISDYMYLFPSLIDKEPYWKALAMEVYRNMDKENARLLPVIRPVREKEPCGRSKKQYPSKKDDKKDERVTIEWFAPTGEGSQRAYFNDLESTRAVDRSSKRTTDGVSTTNKPAAEILLPNANTKNVATSGRFQNCQIASMLTTSNNSLQAYARSGKTLFSFKEAEELKKTILDVGFNLLEASMMICHNFKDSEVDVSCVSPPEVVAFFRSLGQTEQLCNVGELPAPLKETPFKDVNNLLLVLKYCNECEEFLQTLNGLPLLLTQDEVLRVFDAANPAYLTTHLDITPGCTSQFVHRSLYNSTFHIQENPGESKVFKKFDIAAFSELLPLTLDLTYAAGDHYVSWVPDDPTKKNLPSSRWLYKVWCFLSSEINKRLSKYDDERTKLLSSRTERHYEEERTEAKKEKSQLVRQALVPVQSWCLLPATVTAPSTISPSNTESRHFLVPLGMAETVISLSSMCGAFLCDVLKRLSLPEVNCMSIDDSHIDARNSKVALMIVASLENPRAVLRSLSHKLLLESLPYVLSPGQCKELLGFFSKNVRILEGDSDALKKLPFYATVHGDLISIHGKTAYVLPEGIPKDDMHIWEEKAGIVFLQGSTALNDLYVFLGCASKSEVDVYCDIIFPKFQDMSEQARLAHLKFLYKFLAELKSTFEQHLLANMLLTDMLLANKFLADKLLGALTILKFLPDKDGQLKTASSFYDPHNPVFKVMFQGEEGKFPPKLFSATLGVHFLRQIGLIHAVTAEKFIEFAKEVEAEARTRECDATKEKSRVLVEHLFSRKNVATESLLREVKHIKFVSPYRAREDLTQLYPQYGSTPDGKLCYVSFEGSLVIVHERIAWTSESILPSEADPYKCSWLFTMDYGKRHNLNNSGNYRDKIVMELGIHPKPPLEVVVNHCLKICGCLHKELAKRKQYDKRNVDNIMRIMSEIYQFLQNSLKCTGDGALDRLRGMPVIVVEGGKRFVLPDQIVIECLPEQEIYPHLYKVPLEIAQYHKLFRHLGATETVTASQYALVLNSIYQECGKDATNPNETKKAFKATKGLFDELSKEKGTRIAEESVLHLPGEKRSSREDSPSQAFIRLSTELVCDDAPHFRNRIGNFEPLLLVRLKECKINANNDDALVDKLPEKLRPRMLTKVVHERLMDDAVTSTDHCLDTAGVLKQVLSSAEFCLGFIRLVRHEEYEEGRTTNEDIVSIVKNRLSHINVVSVANLRTHLVYEGRVVTGSEADVSCFEEQIDQNGVEMWTIYIKQDGVLMDFVSRVAEVVNRITGRLLTRCLVHLPTMLQKMPESIKLFLDNSKIREDNSSITASCLPKPGSFVHMDDHHLLEDAFEDFEPGEYVGYELDDPSLRNEDGAATYIYAIVIEEVVEKGAQSSFATKRYRINVGNDKEPIIVDGVDLYKFHRIKGSPFWELAVYEGKTVSAKKEKPEDLQEAMDEVTRTLEEAWKQPKDKRNKIIKRLFLRWHPDKNPGNEEFCKKVFQHIQDEIERLKERRTGSAPSYDYWAYNDYSDLFSRWGRRANRYSYQRSHYSSRYYSTGYRQNPQPGEARRWFRQAEADLAAVANDIGMLSAAYEWACFKCHQAAEKALKAAQYSRDADKTNIHELNLNASSLNDATLSNLASELEGLVGRSPRMRYPDCLSYPSIPHDVYTQSQTQTAYQLAKDILARVREKFIH